MVLFENRAMISKKLLIQMMHFSIFQFGQFLFFERF